MSRFDAVLFDFDGTVADTGKGIFGGVYHTLAHMGLEPPPEEKLRYFIGPPLHDSFQTVFGFDAETSDAAVKKYREYYREKGMFELTFYDGMEELLVRLRVSGVKTGIASAKPDIFLKEIIARYQVDEFFDTIAGSDINSIHSDKAEIISAAIDGLGGLDKSRVLMAGDRKFDIAGAKTAGVKSCGVLYGYGSRAELEEAGAEYLVKTPGEIFEIVKS